MIQDPQVWIAFLGHLTKQELLKWGLEFTLDMQVQGTPGASGASQVTSLAPRRPRLKLETGHKDYWRRTGTRWFVPRHWGSLLMDARDRAVRAEGAPSRADCFVAPYPTFGGRVFIVKVIMTSPRRPPRFKKDSLEIPN